MNIFVKKTKIMSLPISFCIKESLKELQKLLKDSSVYLAPRLKMLIECKKHESTGLSKRVIAEQIGVNPNSVQKWRNMYIAGGIKALLTHNKIGYKPSLLNQSDYEKIKEKLHDEKNPIKGFIELQQWIMEELNKDIRYTTVFGYAKRHFGAKIKVSRKSHIHKDKEAVETFKKTSVKFAKKPLNQSKLNIAK
jgi:transposase